MVTIKDIAKYFGVSVGTVSKALNNQKGVSETLRDKIKDYAEEQNYTPNLTAINLVKRETNKIALFILSKATITTLSITIEIITSIKEKAFFTTLYLFL